MRKGLAGSHGQKQRSRRDSSVANAPSEKRGVSTPSQVPQPGTPKPGKGAHLTPGCENQQGFCPWKRDTRERERSLLER